MTSERKVDILGLVSELRTEIFVESGKDSHKSEELDKYRVDH